MNPTPAYTYLYIPLEHMPFGKDRRDLIMSYFDSTPNAAYVVNRRYRPQLKDDPDLRKLIKTGKLKRIRVARGSTRSYSTMLIKP